MICIPFRFDKPPPRGSDQLAISEYVIKTLFVTLTYTLPTRCEANYKTHGVSSLGRDRTLRDEINRLLHCSEHGFHYVQHSLSRVHARNTISKLTNYKA